MTPGGLGSVCELHACIVNNIGAMARLAASLVGMAFSPAAPRGGGLALSFDGLRHFFVRQATAEGAVFCFEGYASLWELASGYSNVDPNCVRSYAKVISGPGVRADSRVWDAFESATQSSASLGMQMTETTMREWFVSPQVAQNHCPAMGICEIAGVAERQRRRVDAGPGQVAVAKLALARTMPPAGLARRAKRTVAEGQVFVCTYLPWNLPGLIAYVLGALTGYTLSRVDGVKCGTGQQQETAFWNTEYFRSYICHNDRFAMAQMIGSWLPAAEFWALLERTALKRQVVYSNSDPAQVYRELYPVRLLQIRPTNVGSLEADDRWWSYLEQTRGVLGPGEYESRPIDRAGVWELRTKRLVDDARIIQCAACARNFAAVLAGDEARDQGIAGAGCEGARLVRHS